MSSSQFSRRVVSNEVTNTVLKVNKLHHFLVLILAMVIGGTVQHVMPCAGTLMFITSKNIHTRR